MVSMTLKNKISDFLNVNNLLKLCLVLCLSSVVGATRKKFSKSVLVKTTQGSVVGIRTLQSGIFYGIPFSQPPVGDYRWRRPRDPVLFSDIYWNATYKRPGCPQVCPNPLPQYTCPPATDEDCLYLNVWIPRRILTKVQSDKVLDREHYVVAPEYQKRGKSLPVMVWFYGGAFSSGAGSCTLYEGRYLAHEGDVVVVTTNYRVAHLGFLVQGSGAEESRGNFGFWDQIKALEWVQKNIHNFGGNPNRVTLFGQSAGAESIGIHMTSTYSKHLFHQAIMQSNPFSLPFRDLKDARKFGSIFAKAAGCKKNDMACLRSKSVVDLEKAFNATSHKVINFAKLSLAFQTWGPVIDKDVVPNQPLKLYIQGKAQKKPTIIGSTTGEGISYAWFLSPRKLSSVTYKILLLAITRERLFQVLTKYPAKCNGADVTCDNRKKLSDLITQYFFVCPQRKALSSSAEHNQWWYIFNQTLPFHKAWNQPICFDNVCHGSELPFVFDSEKMMPYTFAPKEQKLTKRMISYWTNFAKFGNPNKSSDKRQPISTGVSSSHLNIWPKFRDVSSRRPKYQALEFLAERDSVVEQPYEEPCNFWDSLNVYSKL